MKLLIMGYAKHGKDTASEYLRDKYSMNFVSSSMFCAEHVVYPVLKYKYASARECYDNRSSDRSTWFDLITDYNTKDVSRLGREIFAAFDIYCGLRNKREFNALKNSGIFNYAIWIDRSPIVADESESSCTVKPWMADYVLDNTGTIDDLKRNVDVLMSTIHPQRLYEIL